jgi:RNA polymerase sigma-70 factor (ECF subfamily)
MAYHEGRSAGDFRFASTNWKLIAAARGDDQPEARRALADLCEGYWYPLYAYVRRRGYPADRAQDLVQGFFADLLGRDFLVGLAPEKGKFRSFLLRSLQNYLAKQHVHDHAHKRGGGVAVVSFDLPAAEGRYAYEPAHELTAERLFERRWALTLLDRVIEQLTAEMARDGKTALFERLRPTFLGAGEVATHACIAVELGMTEGAVKAAALRLRRRYRELIRAEVGRTVEDAGDVEAEIRALFAALA